MKKAFLLTIMAIPMMFGSSTARANLIQNGSFEILNVPPLSEWTWAYHYISIFSPNNSAIPFWTVTEVSVDINYSVLWAASQGDYSLDISGTGAGAIEQSFITKPGYTYVVSFDMAGNSNAAPVIKTLEVSAAGKKKIFTFDTTGHSDSNMGWTRTYMSFVAYDTNTTLKFKSLDDSYYGPTIDSVEVIEIGPASENDIPVPGDYDGDGENDIAVWRPSDGTWYVKPSSGAPSIVVQWGDGSLGDIPVPGDFDGDGKTDFAVWRPSNGTWYVKPSSGIAPVVTQWGDPALGDIPVPGDYDKDGKTDFVVWRRSTGTWYVRPSSGIAPIVTQWGE